MAKDHAAVINSLGKTIRNQQQIIENMESKNYRQSCVLARVNQERDKTAMELKAKDTKIHKLQEEINALKASFSGYGNRAVNMVEMITEMWQEIKKQRISQP